MVAYKTRDARSRHSTYAERTITAISDIHKRNPRSSIHVKTLIAQIRRNAEAQKDVLGPRWRTGVNVACKALTERGVLDPEHPPGRIALTPEGRQMLATTRHSIGLRNDHEHDPECQENLGRKFIGRLSHAGTRSGRGTSVITSREDESVEKPILKKTKAELLAENKRIREEYEALKHESARKLAELNAELENREDEWLEYQDRLTGFNESESEIGDATLAQDESAERVASTNAKETSGAPVVEEAVPSVEEEQTRRPSESRLADVNIISRKSLHHPSVLRTNSGSFISSISKQPTPAPSDAGTEPIPGSPVQSFMELDDAIEANRVELNRGNNEIDFGANIDTSFDPDTTLSGDSPISIDALKTPSARPGMQTHTPMTSPVRAPRRNVSKADEVRKRIEKLVDERQEERIHFEKELSAKNDVLKEREDRIRFLESKLSGHSKLEGELRVLHEQYNAIQGQLKGLEAEKAQLLGHVSILKAQLHEKSVGLQNLQVLHEQKARDYANTLQDDTGRSNDLENRLAGVQQEIISTESARQSLQDRLDKAMTDTEDVKKSLQDVVRDLQAGLEDACEREAKLRQDVQQKQDESERLQLEVQASTAQTADAREHLAGIQAKLNAESVGKARLESELVIAREQNGSLERNLNALRGELNDTQRELHVEREGAHNLHESLREVVARNEKLTADLEEKQAALLDSQDSSAKREAEFLLLQDQLRSTRAAVNDSQASLESLQAKMQGTTTQNALLVQALKDAEEEVADMKDGYEKLKRTHLAEFEEMDKMVSRKRKRASMPPLRTV